MTASSGARARLTAAACAGALLVTLGVLAPARARAAPTPRCTTRQLQVRVLEIQGATSHSYWEMALRNNGAATCRLQGYPGVGLLDAQGALFAGEVARQPGQPTPSVTLARGRSAYFTFGYVVAGPCAPHDFKAYGVAVYAPHQLARPALDIHATLEVCDRSVGGPALVYPIRVRRAV